MRNLWRRDALLSPYDILIEQANACSPRGMASVKRINGHQVTFLLKDNVLFEAYHTDNYRKFAIRWRGKLYYCKNEAQLVSRLAKIFHHSETLLIWGRG